MDELKLGVNTGVVIVEPKPTDFVAGAETGILDVPVLASADWRPFLPTYVTQLMKKSNGVSIGDTNACVSFGGKQSVETQLIHQLKTSVVSADNAAWLAVKGYIDSTGKVLLSARFTAKMSGTDPNVGNSLPNVWASLKNNGAVPESVWPMPNFDSCNTTQDGWNLYYASIPQSVIDLGNEFKARFPVLYEWLITPATPAAGSKVLADLTVSPLEIATAVCAGWNTDDPIKACGAGTQHATMLTFVEGNGVYDILDHYNPFQKQFAGDYNITYGMRGVVGQVLAPAPASFHYVFTKQLTYGAANNDPADLKALQQALQYLTSKTTGKPYMAPGVFGPFGPQTAAALAAFETDHSIVDPQPGHNFGPQNRAIMNAALG